jgi:hypothetical protein
MILFFILVLAFILILAILQGKSEIALLVTGLLVPLGILYYLPELCKLGFIILFFITVVFIISKTVEYLKNK